MTESNPENKAAKAGRSRWYESLGIRKRTHKNTVVPAMHGRTGVGRIFTAEPWNFREMMHIGRKQTDRAQGIYTNIKRKAVQ